ncbi:iron-sulfur assembly protein 1 [Echria macrotheca]|uniref:Iron-sulfur assembly protein 1 n=1 Tax=Echria macrotheca TaxID=438768 RepID=A0AAJ0B593_9PEZI|nr:iron-sulfur assembly protein 1 [Echria macrotheca]
MNAPRILSSRTTLSVCQACRRTLLREKRHFASSPARTVAAFQSYPLPSQLPSSPAPRNASVPDTSIAQTLPRVHETRPPPQSTTADVASIPEREAQTSQPAFASTTTSRQPTSSSSPQAQSQYETASSKPAAPQPQKPRFSKLRAPRKAAMKLTPAAVAQLRAMLDGPDPKLIKVGVRNRGCSGLAYHLEYVDGAGKFDETVEQDGVRVLVDSKALFSIIGSEMDWVEDKLSQRFVFRNPNIKEQCGCGESFMV